MTTLYKSLFSVTVFTALLGNVFQQRTFLCFRPHVLAGWRPSLKSLLLFKLPSQDYLGSQSQSYINDRRSSNKARIWGLRPDLYYCQSVAAGPRYIASAWIAHKTPYQTGTLFGDVTIRAETPFLCCVSNPCYADELFTVP
jgi:hypothetical protein